MAAGDTPTAGAENNKSTIYIYIYFFFFFSFQLKAILTSVFMTGSLPLSSADIRVGSSSVGGAVLGTVRGFTASLAPPP